MGPLTTLLCVVTFTFSPPSGVFHYPLQSGGHSFAPGEPIAGGLGTQAGPVGSDPSW